jgi:hypothetical protein
MNRILLLSSVMLALSCGQEPTAPLNSGTVRQSLREAARTHARDGAQLVADFVTGGFIDLALDDLCASMTDATEECTTPEIELEPADADEAIEDILTEFFSDDRVISENATEVIYAVRSASICGSDSECVAKLDQLMLRLIVSQPAPGTIQIVLRAANHDVFFLNLASDTISLEADLGEARAVVAENASIFDLMEQDIPTASGRVRLALHRLGARHYAADLAVTQDIAIHHSDSQGTYDVAIESATLIAVDADAAVESLVVTLAVDRVSASLPANAFDFLFEQSLGGGTATLELSGLTGSVDLANLENELTAIGLGLGQTTSSFSLDGADLLTVDVNENLGRELDLMITATDARYDVTVTPGATLSAHLFLQPLADRGHEVPAWALDSQNDASFTAAQGTPALSLTDDQVRIEIGTLRLESSASSAPVVIDAGMCVAADDSLDIDVVHPFSTVYGMSCN